MQCTSESAIGTGTGKAWQCNAKAVLAAERDKDNCEQTQPTVKATGMRRETDSQIERGIERKREKASGM